MSTDNDLKRNNGLEIVPQGYSEELQDWKEVIVDQDGKQYVRDTEVLAKLTEMDIKLQSLENTIDADGNQKVTLNGNIVEEIDITAEIGTITAGASKSISLPPEFRGEFIFASISFRRSQGEISKIELEHRSQSFSSVVGACRTELKKVNQATTVDVTEKGLILTGDFRVVLTAAGGDDFVPNGVSLHLWRR